MGSPGELDAGGSSESGWVLPLAKVDGGWVSRERRQGGSRLAGGLGGSASREGWEGRPRGRAGRVGLAGGLGGSASDRKSTRLNSSHVKSSYAVFCLKK